MLLIELQFILLGIVRLKGVLRRNRSEEGYKAVARDQMQVP